MCPQILLTDLEAHADALVAAHPAFAPIRTLVGPLRPRARDGGFAGMLYTILGQQVSVASARAQWARLGAAGLDQPEPLRQASDEVLRACGLSRQKIAYARHIASSEIDWPGLEALDDDQVIARLMKLKGVGRWSAEIYAKFSLGRADIFAAGDLALQEAARVMADMPTRPDADSLRRMASVWSPNRTVAAMLLWQYYGVLKSREGVA